MQKPSSGDTDAPQHLYVNAVATGVTTTPDEQRYTNDTAADQSQPVYQQLNTRPAAARRAPYENIRPHKLRRQRRAESSN